MSKLIGYIVAGATVVVGASVGLGVYFGTKNNNEKSINPHIRNYDFHFQSEDDCTESQCGIGGFSIKQLPYNNGFFLSKDQLKELYSWWKNDVVYGPEIASFNGIVIKHDSGSTESGVTFGDYSWYKKTIRLYTEGYRIVNNNDKVKFFKYTLAHEYGHHFTHWYFKNGINSSNVSKEYKTSNDNIIEFNKQNIDQYIQLRSLNTQPDFIECNPAQPSCDKKTIQGQEAKYYINILEWLTRDETYMTQKYIPDQKIGGTTNVMYIDNLIRDDWGNNGGNDNLTNNLDKLNIFYKKIIGINPNLNNGWGINSVSQRIDDGIRYSMFFGFTNKKYDCIVETIDNKITTSLPIKYISNLFNYQFRTAVHTNSADPVTKESLSSSPPLYTYYSDEFTPNIFQNGSELNFSTSCNDINGIEKLPTAFPGESEHFLAGQGDEAVEPVGEFSANVSYSVGSVYVSNVNNYQRFVYNSNRNSI